MRLITPAYIVPVAVFVMDDLGSHHNREVQRGVSAVEILTLSTPHKKVHDIYPRFMYFCQDKIFQPRGAVGCNLLQKTVAAQSGPRVEAEAFLRQDNVVRGEGDLSDSKFIIV